MRRLLAIPAVAVLLALGSACASGPDADLSRGRAALERGDHARAAEHLEAALAGPQDFAARYETLSELGETYLLDPGPGREARAGDLFRAALELTEEWLPPDHPAHLDALERLGRYYAITGDWERARPVLETYMALAERSVDPETLYGSGPSRQLLDAYGRLGEDEKYEALRARQRNPLLWAMREGTRVEELAPAELCVAPNARDAQGRGVYAGFTRADMPLRVVVGDPPSNAIDSSAEQTRLAAVQGIRAWQIALRRLLPWFELHFVEPGEAADVVVEFKDRGRYYLPGVGEIGIAADGRARGRVTLAPQPVPNADYRVPRGELSVWATHAFGSALGLVDCWHADSVMSIDWRRGARFQPTDRDIRAFEALAGRVGGAPDPLPPAAAGVLADVPMINSGDAADLLIDLAPPGSREFPLQLDTGATDTVLSSDYARALGITVRRIKSDAYRRDTVTGDALRFWITAQGGGTERRHFDYALLGGEFLRAYVVDLDFQRRRVRFLDPAIHDVRDETARLPGERLVPLEIRSTWPFAQLELGNGSVWALVDTGSQGPITITEEKATELGIAIDPDAERVRFVNVFGTSIKHVQTLERARLGGVVLNEPSLMIGSRSESSVRIARWLQDETIIGLPILQRFRVRLDYPHGVMGLTPVGDAL